VKPDNLGKLGTGPVGEAQNDVVSTLREGEVALTGSSIDKRPRLREDFDRMANLPMLDRFVHLD